MRFRSQNLNEKPGRKLGSMWREGRCWLYFGERGNLEFDWSFFKRSSPALTLSLGNGDDAIQIHVAFYIFSFFFIVDHYKLGRWLADKTKRKGQKYGNGRDIGIKYHGGTLWIDLWADNMEYHKDDPKWWRFNFGVEDFIKGKAIYTKEILEERDISVPMPEKAYPAKAVLSLQTWKYPRWFTQSRKSVEIEIKEGGIPVEGKGENSWDCGEDATYSFSCTAKNIGEGVGHFVGRMLSERVRHGGWKDWHWERPPAPPQPAQPAGVTLGSSIK